MHASLAGERFQLGNSLSPSLEDAFYEAASRLMASEVERLYVSSLIDRVRQGELSLFTLLHDGATAGAICYRSVDREAELIYGFTAPDFEESEGAFLGMVANALVLSGVSVIRSGFCWPGQARFTQAAARLGFITVPRLSMMRNVDEGQMFSFTPSPGVNILPWSSTYFDDVCRIMHEESVPVDQLVYPLFASPEGSRALLLSIIRDRHGVFMPRLSAVAQVNDEVIGFLLSSQLVDGSVLVIDIAVKAEHRNKGIGGQMLQYLISRCAMTGKRMIVLAVTAENAHAIGLYKKMGFQEMAAFEQHVLKIDV